MKWDGRPALEPEDWEYIRGVNASDADDSWENRYGECMGRHEAAARALHGQPFGFTWEDVDMLRDEATMRGFMAMDAQENPIDRAKQAGLNDLADRIAALLPPRGER